MCSKLRYARLATVIVLMSCVSPRAAGAADGNSAVLGDSATVVVTAHFSSRTSFKVSSDLLRFHLTESDGRATTAVDFRAAARTASSAEVTLSVEPLPPVEMPAKAVIDPVISVTGLAPGGEGTVVAHGSPGLASRWFGSGVRTGRLIFTLQAGAVGRYSIPVQFVLSAP